MIHLKGNILYRMVLLIKENVLARALNESIKK